MRYFKNPADEVFGYEVDGSQEDLIVAAIETEWEEVTGHWPPASVVDPVEANKEAIQAELDRRARERGYDNIISACSYAAQEVGAPFQAEGAAFLQWRSAVWTNAYAVLAEVKAKAGNVPMPSPAEAVAMMPILSLPA